MNSPMTEEQLRARYAELLGFMGTVKEQVDWWRESFPKAQAAKDLYEDFHQVFTPFEEIYRDLEAGRASWGNDAIPDILKHADEIRAATLDHMMQIPFQASCSASEED